MIEDKLRIGHNDSALPESHFFGGWLFIAATGTPDVRKLL
jgi:hypothetical protein